MILLGTGVEPVDLDSHADTNFNIARLLIDEDAIPENVLAGCFPLVSAYKEHPEAKLAWFTPEGEHKPVVSRFREWLQGLLPEENNPPTEAAEEERFNPQDHKPIKHYLLLPHPRWGNADWFIKVTRPFIKKYSPTTGYSIREAFYAHQVTIVGGVQAFPETLKTDLERAGCKVIQIDGSGTEIATRLAEL